MIDKSPLDAINSDEPVYDDGRLLGRVAGPTGECFESETVDIDHPDVVDRGNLSGDQFGEALVLTVGKPGAEPFAIAQQAIVLRFSAAGRAGAAQMVLA